MKLDLLYTGHLGNLAKTHKYRRMSPVVMDSNSFIIGTGTDLISPTLAKKIKMGGLPSASSGVLWSPVAGPGPYKARHRRYMGVSR